GFTRFIVAGGETSSIVAQTLGVEAFHIGEHKKYWGSVSYAAIAGPFPSL
ncbi:TPA: hypothetical protein ACMEJZ_005171, partial [Klebsiella pneumoniae]